LPHRALDTYVRVEKPWSPGSFQVGAGDSPALANAWVARPPSAAASESDLPGRGHDPTNRAR